MENKTWDWQSAQYILSFIYILTFRLHFILFIESDWYIAALDLSHSRSPDG